MRVRKEAMFLNLGVQGASRYAETYSSLGDVPTLGFQCLEDVALLNLLEREVAGCNIRSKVLPRWNLELGDNLVNESIVG